MFRYQTLHGDCVKILSPFQENCIDSCVTDVPYNIDSIIKRFGKVSLNDNTQTSREAKEGSTSYGRLVKNFAGKSWDTEVAFDPCTWSPIKRLLKPGGYLVGFCSARKYHKLATAVEAAGFEIRDMFAWIYATGFAKRNTFLRPGIEPILFARKPLEESTVLKNIETWGVGGLNIDACRIDGKYPTNVFHDGSEEVIEAFNSYSTNSHSFFYSGKTSKAERNLGGIINDHATVKRIDLMKWLIDLVTPKNGTVLDPFMGSGTTGISAFLGGYNFIGVEKEREYFDLANNRLEYIQKQHMSTNSEALF